MSSRKATPPPTGADNAIVPPLSPDEPGDEERQLRRLAVFLQDAAGFRLGIAEYDSPQTRERVLRRLEEMLAGTDVRLTRLDLTDTPGEKWLLERLRRHWEALVTQEKAAGHRHAVMVVGIEATLDYRRLAPEATEGLAILENANLHRDAFPQACPAPVVLWLNLTAVSALAMHAPDLWHWRSGTFRFGGGSDTRQHLERQYVDMPLMESLSLPRREKRERIAMLHDLLTELEASPEATTRQGRRRRMDLQRETGVAHLDLGDARRAIEHFEQALSLAREIGDRRGEGRALGNLGNVYYVLGDVRKAIEFYKNDVAIAREVGDRRGESTTLGNLGNAYAASGDMRKAIELYEKHLAIAREVGDRGDEGSALGNLGAAYAGLGDVRKAIELYEKHLAIAREIGDRRGEGTTLGNLGAAYAELGDVRKAIELYEQALLTCRRIGDRREEGIVLWNRSLALDALGQRILSIADAKAALEIAEQIGDPNAETVRQQLAKWRGGKPGA